MLQLFIRSHFFLCPEVINEMIILAVSGKQGLGEKGWILQCKMQCLVWIGLLKNKKDMLKHMPQGYSIPPNIAKSTAPPPCEIQYTESHKYTLRAHLYQARGLIGKIFYTIIS